jgi:chromosome segregation ATPase
VSITGTDQAARIMELTDELARRDAQLKESVDHEVEYERRIVQLEGDYDALAAQLAERDMRIAGWKQEYDARLADLAECMQRIKQLEAENLCSRVRYETCESVNDAMQARIEQLEAALRKIAAGDRLAPIIARDALAGSSVDRKGEPT